MFPKRSIAFTIKIIISLTYRRYLTQLNSILIEILQHIQSNGTLKLPITLRIIFVMPIGAQIHPQYTSNPVYQQYKPIQRIKWSNRFLWHWTRAFVSEKLFNERDFSIKWCILLAPLPTLVCKGLFSLDYHALRSQCHFCQCLGVCRTYTLFEHFLTVPRMLTKGSPNAEMITCHYLPVTWCVVWGGTVNA